MDREFRQTFDELMEGNDSFVPDDYVEQDFDPFDEALQALLADES